MSKVKHLRTQMIPREKALGWLYFLLELFVLPTVLHMLNDALPRPLPEAVLNFIFFCLNFVVILLVFHRFLLKSLESAGKKFWNFFQATLLGFVAYWVCSFALGYLILLLKPDFANINDAGIAAMADSHFILMAVGTVILVPVVEECFFRGLLFLELQPRNRVLAYCLSTVGFCMIHVMGYIGQYDWLTLVLCFLQYIPAGLWLAWAYEKSDSIFAPILIHTAINAIGIYAMR